MAADADTPAAADPVVARAVEMLRGMTDDQRLEAMGEFCGHCGTDDPRCRCWDDS